MLCRQRHCRSTLQCVGKTACTQIAYTSAHCLLDCCHWLHLTALPPPDSSTALGVEDTSTMERATASANNIDLEVINEAITIVAGAQFCISREESELIFDGLSIPQQLIILTSMKGLPEHFHAQIMKQAQELTTRHSGQNSNQWPSNEWLPGSVRSELWQMQSMGMILSL